MQRDVKIVRTFAQSPERVWHALTDSRELASWLMDNDFVAEPNRAFTFQMKAQRGWDGTTHCQITALEPLRRLAYTYRGHATGEKPLHCAGIESKAADDKGRGIFFDLDTELGFTLEPHGQGTRLVIDHRGFKGLKLMLVSLIMEMGWRRSVLPRLRSQLAK